MSLEERRVIDYFIVAGLPETQVPLHDLPQKPTQLKWPIVDVAIINKSQGELPPEGYQVVEQTPSGQPANLNHGSMLAPELFLCYKRGWNKPPIIDIGVMYSIKDQPKMGCKVLTQTPYGRSANVNNTGGEKIYITYIRADEAADSDALAVVDIRIILPNKNEKPPHAFRRIEKNLNRGMLGSDVFLCYKKSIVKNNSLNYEADLLFRYPAEDLPDYPLPHQVAMFCLPFGAAIESWLPGARHPLPIFSTFVLTGATGERVYGAAVIFYEEFDRKNLKADQVAMLGLKSAKKQLSVHQNQSICILSRWPFFDTFKKFLLTLYRLSVSGPQSIPLERHIGHFMLEVPFPTRERPRILVQLSTESVTLLLPEETPLPKSGASFTKMLMNLGPDNIISLLLCVLTEHRILIHSLRPDLLTSVAEAVVSMIFPFRWQCPYIPLCPLQLSVLLDSPTPFIIGLDSRYFDMFDPPPDITFVDLDTCAITVYDEQRGHAALSMPKRAVRVLKSTLEELYEQFLGDSSHPSTPDELDRHGVLSTHAFKGRRKLEILELSIQEAFLHFMAGILKDYDKFLLPVEQAPENNHITDVDSLFNIQGFINSREKSSRAFFHQMLRTQYFSRFIDERSFVSDENVGLAFFDDCIHKLETAEDSAILLECDETAALSERTVFILPPEPPSVPSGVLFSYKGFTELKPGLFTPQARATEVPKLNSASNTAAIGSMLKRTKQEIKAFQKSLGQIVDQAEPTAKCLLWICYSLWFICLPFHIQNVPSKIKLLEEALEVLRQMHRLQIQPLDEVCYRILMHLCCVYNRPVFAIKIFHEMKQNHIHPNAITYGFYNKAVVESKWMSSVTSSTRSWNKLRNVVFATIRFRLLYLEKKLRERMSGSNADGCDSSLPPEIPCSVPMEGSNGLNVKTALNQRDCGSQDSSALSIAAFDAVQNTQSGNDNSGEVETKIIESPSRMVPVLMPVRENDPLGLFGPNTEKEGFSNAGAAHSSNHKERFEQDFLNKTCDSSTLKFLKNPNVTADTNSSKSKSCDELINNQHSDQSARPSIKMRRRGSLKNEEKISEDTDYHAKTLSRLDKLKSEAAKKSTLPRTGSFGSAWNSAVTLFSSTYQTLRDSLSTGSSGQNIDNAADFSNVFGLLNPLDSDQRAWSASSLNSKRGETTVDRNQVDDSFTTDSGLSTGYDSADYHRSDHGSNVAISGSGLSCAIKADLCTQSKCPNCANLLHDEEIMAGWSSEESNLQTRCLCCGYNFLPMIHINLRDFRHNGESTNYEEKSFGKKKDSVQNFSDLSLSSEVSNGNNSSDNICNNSSLTCDSTDGNVVSNVRKDKSTTEAVHLNAHSSSDFLRTGSENGRDVAETASVDPVVKKSNDSFSRFPSKDESFTVTYLNPLVLRKEVENLIELRGEDCLSKAGFVNDHPIIFWNLVWFFQRLHLSTHLTGLISDSLILRNDNSLESDQPTTEANCTALVKTLWDGRHNYTEYGYPMYMLWKFPEMVAESANEVMNFSVDFLRDILLSVSQSDIQSAIEKVLTERKRTVRKGKILYRSIYYDILFLAISAGGSKFNISNYDHHYREACNDISPSFSARLMEADRPPRMSTVYCRRHFGLLQL